MNLYNIQQLVAKYQNLLKLRNITSSIIHNYIEENK